MSAVSDAIAEALKVLPPDQLAAIAQSVGVQTPTTATPAPAVRAKAPTNGKGKLSEQDKTLLAILERYKTEGKAGTFARPVHGYLKACGLNDRAIIDAAIERGTIVRHVYPKKNKAGMYAVYFPAGTAPHYEPKSKVSESEAAKVRASFQ